MCPSPNQTEKIILELFQVKYGWIGKVYRFDCLVRLQLQGFMASRPIDLLFQKTLEDLSAFIVSRTSEVFINSSPCIILSIRMNGKFSLEQSVASLHKFTSVKSTHSLEGNDGIVRDHN